MLGISLSPLVYFGAAAAVVAGLWWAHDAIGDAREEQVHASYQKAADWKNRDLRAANLHEERAYALMEGALAKAVEGAAHVKGTCQATPEQAEALTTIRRAR